jgi:hypothetical protein
MPRIAIKPEIPQTSWRQIGLVVHEPLHECHGLDPALSHRTAESEMRMIAGALFNFVSGRLTRRISGPSWHKT